MNCDNDREAFERTVIEKCGFNPETSLMLSETTSEYKSDVIHFAWVMWKASKEFYSKTYSDIPDGFVVVPKEPTEKMIDAGHDFCKTNIVTPTGFYKAMIEQTLIDNATAQEKNQ